MDQTNSVQGAGPVLHGGEEVKASTLRVVHPPPRPVPFRLPWPRARVTCRPVIGDKLLLHYPQVAKALAERSRSEEAIDRVAGSGRMPAQEGAAK